MDDQYIEKLMLKTDYYELKKKHEEFTFNLYNSEKLRERLNYLGFSDKKYQEQDYLKKINFLEYPRYIYENFQQQTGYKYIKCEFLNLPIFNLNANADCSPSQTPLIIVDFSLLMTLDLMCYSYITFLFIKSGRIKCKYEHKSESQIIQDHVFPIWIVYFKYFRSKSYPDLVNGTKFLYDFSNENDDIINNYTKLSRSIALFIICHEQAHHELGHIEQSSFLKGANSTEDIRNRYEKREFDADKFALKMFMECVNPESKFGLFNTLDTFYIAPFIFFEMLYSIEWIQEINYNNKLYPLSKQRFMNLLNTYIDEKYDKDILIEDIETWSDYFETMKLIATKL